MLRTCHTAVVEVKQIHQAWTGFPWQAFLAEAESTPPPLKMRPSQDVWWARVLSPPRVEWMWWERVLGPGKMHQYEGLVRKLPKSGPSLSLQRSGVALLVHSGSFPFAEMHSSSTPRSQTLLPSLPPPRSVWTLHNKDSKHSMQAACFVWSLLQYCSGKWWNANVHCDTLQSSPPQS